MHVIIQLEPWLAQWARHVYGDEIEFEKGSMENRVLELSLRRPPTVIPERKPMRFDEVRIKLPNFKRIDTRQVCYLPAHGKRALRRCIRLRFVVKVWEELNKFGTIGKKKSDIIYSFMESNGIEKTEGNFFAIFKIYQRQRAYYLRKEAEKR